MSVYDKIKYYIGSLKPILHFTSVSGPLQKDGLKSKINSPTQINIGNYWLHCEDMIFPQLILKVRSLVGKL